VGVKKKKIKTHPMYVNSGGYIVSVIQLSTSIPVCEGKGKNCCLKQNSSANLETRIARQSKTEVFVIINQSINQPKAHLRIKNDEQKKNKKIKKIFQASEKLVSFI
jgi:hypothetical protein